MPTGGTVLLAPGAVYRITATLNVTGPCRIWGNGSSIYPNLSNAASPYYTNQSVFLITSSNVSVDGVNIDYTNGQTGNEGNRYGFFIVGQSIASHTQNVAIRNCSITNIETGNFPTAIVGAHAIWATQTDHARFENNFISSVSGFGIFTEDNVDTVIRGNTLINTGWASIVSNSGDNRWVCDSNYIGGTNPYNRDEGGSIALNGTVSDGFGPTYNSVICNNYVTGSVAYGNSVRLGSVQNCDVYGNIFDQVYSGTGQTGGAFGPAVISADTRGSQPYACRNLKIHDNLIIAPLSSLITLPVGIVAVQVENNDWSGMGTPGRAQNIEIYSNSIIS